MRPESRPDPTPVNFRAFSVRYSMSAWGSVASSHGDPSLLGDRASSRVSPPVKASIANCRYSSDALSSSRSWYSRLRKSSPVRGRKLSYPNRCTTACRASAGMGLDRCEDGVAPRAGLEPATNGLTVRRSTLSYRGTGWLFEGARFCGKGSASVKETVRSMPYSSSDACRCSKFLKAAPAMGVAARNADQDSFYAPSGGREMSRCVGRRHAAASDHGPYLDRVLGRRANVLTEHRRLPLGTSG